ncbi:hypothetical protein GCM10010489_11550 [Microbacterium saperdae]|uniref:Uncharacterized protein n=1 Tax=Microbacterium saperdae TaxID=69368 RepID=A0A543BQU4_9MICO|nr:hypothetical protein FB560_2861 [Microbacterium saperdae]GGM42165.1 hypothetical protein GCM10010489_11550 [Microbacterium saperdae]
MIAYEPETGVAGNARVVSIRPDRDVAFLRVDWASIASEAVVDAQSPLEMLRQIVRGIDSDDASGEGWWETSAGAEFGAEKLRQLEILVSSLV